MGRQCKAIPKAPTSMHSGSNNSVDRDCVTQQINIIESKKSLIDVYLLAIFFGIFGAHHFYLRRRFFGFAYLFTFGLFGIGYVVDLLRVPFLIDDEFKRRQNPALEKRKSLFDAYLLWFACGLFGLHHVFLREKHKRYKWGMLYLFTGGIFGLGWLVDLYRMPALVTHANHDPPVMSLRVAYLMAFSPFGPFGAHHFYLRRTRWGWLYLFTFGILGIGWLLDLFRLPRLVNRVLQGQTGHSKEEMYLDDAYILWLFPLGIFGAHQLYLQRHGWGILYFCTFGIFTVGWLIDAFRLSLLVKEFNALKRQQNMLDSLSPEQRSDLLRQQSLGQQSFDVTSYNRFPVRQMLHICDWLDQVC